MNRICTTLLPLALALALATPAGAQTCSGGADGGMDASGAQCNSPPAAPASETVTAARTSDARPADREATTLASLPARTTGTTAEAAPTHRRRGATATAASPRR